MDHSTKRQKAHLDPACDEDSKLDCGECPIFRPEMSTFRETFRCKGICKPRGSVTTGARCARRTRDQSGYCKYHRNQFADVMGLPSDLVGEIATYTDRDSNAMITMWIVPESRQIWLPFVVTKEYEYACQIDWGAKSRNEGRGLFNNTYDMSVRPGTIVEIRIYGTVPAWDFSYSSSSSRCLYSITNWGYARLGHRHETQGYFRDCRQLVHVAEPPDLQESLRNMFMGCTTYNQPIGDWDTSNVTDMSGMFYNAERFDQPIGDWDTSKVTDMSTMFLYCYDFNQPIGNWDTSNVTNMSSMFKYSDEFNQPIGNWDTSNVTNMSNMFNYNMTFNQPIGDWDTSNVEDMSFMFLHSFGFNQPIGTWDISKVNNMAYMFWDISMVNNFEKLRR